MQRVLVKLIVSEHLFYLLKSVTYVLLHYTEEYDVIYKSRTSDVLLSLTPTENLLYNIKLYTI